MRRRQFLTNTISALFLSSCSKKYLRLPASESLTFVDDIPFVGPELKSRLVKNAIYSKDKKKYGKGRNARKFSNLKEIFPIGLRDLRSLNSDQLIMTDENYYTRTEKPNLLSIDELTHIQITENFDNPIELPIQRIISNSKELGVTMMECAGNDKYSGFRLMSAARWGGVSIEEFINSNIFNTLKFNQKYSHVLISGFDDSTQSGYNWRGVQSTAGASWVFKIQDLLKQNAFLATEMNGKPLSIDRGYPCRLVVPGWYGCASIKWVNKIVFFNANPYTATTSQMKEFADRTHQDGTPEIISTYKNPIIDYTAIPIKVEKWKKTNGSFIYRVIGLQWGGKDQSPDLRINISKNNVVTTKNQSVSSVKRDNLFSWQHWWYWWSPQDRGRFNVSLSLNNPNELTRRLDKNYYQQSVKISEI